MVVVAEIATKPHNEVGNQWATIWCEMGFNRRLDAVHRDLHSRLAAGDIGTIEMLRLVSRSATPPPPETAAWFS